MLKHNAGTPLMHLQCSSFFKSGACREVCANVWLWMLFLLHKFYSILLFTLGAGGMENIRIFWLDYEEKEIIGKGALVNEEGVKGWSKGDWGQNRRVSLFIGIRLLNRYLIIPWDYFVFIVVLTYILNDTVLSYLKASLAGRGSRYKNSSQQMYRFHIFRSSSFCLGYSLSVTIFFKV